MNRRLQALKLIFLLWTVLLICRLVYWQVFQSGQLQKAGALQYGHSAVISASRGQIKARDGFPLVKDKSEFLLFIEPQKLHLDSQSADNILNLISASDSARTAFFVAKSSRLSWVPVSHSISESVKSEIEKLNIPGLGFDPEPGRQYLEGSPSAYLTGFVGSKSTGQAQGYFGLEGYYDRVLSGKPGRLLQESDAFNRPIVIGSESRIEAQPGQNLITSIDRTVQFIAYTKLEEGLKKYQAKSGTAVIMESQTGRILAMAAIPGYDPQSYQLYDTSLYKNPIVSDGYEPGSTFKVVVMASALDASAVTPETICTTCDGPQTISGQTVRSYNNKYYPRSNMFDIILHSDNVGMVFVGRQLGRERLLSYLKNFGFGQPTGIDLQDEDTPSLRPDNQWYDIDLATATFGQGIAVTQIQMVTAVNVLANHGLLIPPRVVTAIESDGETSSLPVPKTKRIISSKAASETVQMMRNGVEHGEVRYYRVPGYAVAGKTGTAQVPISGHYDQDKLIASFIGFAPVDHPKFTMLITLREPQTSPWGSTTAAPLWFSIANELFRYYKIPPQGLAL